MLSHEKLYLKLTNQPLDLYDNINREWKEYSYKVEYEFYVKVAETMIGTYLNFEEHQYINFKFVYEEQTLLLAAHVYNIHSTIVASTQNVGVQSISSSGRSISFMSAEQVANQVSIPQYIKDMLPRPRVRMW